MGGKAEARLKDSRDTWKKKSQRKRVSKKELQKENYRGFIQ